MCLLRPTPYGASVEAKKYRAPAFARSPAISGFGRAAGTCYIRCMTAPDYLMLEPEEEEWLDLARGWIKGHFSTNPEEAYDTIEGKLAVVRANLLQGWVGPDDTWKLQSLGIAMGDALAQDLMLEWVTVDDEYGRQPALNWPGTSMLCFPVTMISQRVEEGERVDIDMMYELTRQQLSEIAFGGEAE